MRLLLSNYMIVCFQRKSRDDIQESSKESGREAKIAKTVLHLEDRRRQEEHTFGNRLR